MSEDVAKRESELDRLWLEAMEITKKWQDLVDWYVTGNIGLHPWNCSEKEHDANGCLINVRKFDGDDDFASDYSDFQILFDEWNDRLKSWLSAVPPRFRHRFDEVVSETERFSKRYDDRYAYTGEVPELLALYDDFCKKKMAVDDLMAKTGSDGWRLKDANDIAFVLKYKDMDGDLYINGYKIHHCRSGSALDKALLVYLNGEDKGQVGNINMENLQTSVSMLKIPQGLRKIMLKTSKSDGFIGKPQVTYGDLMHNNLDESKLIAELTKISSEF